jgi:hypothetical protein
MVPMQSDATQQSDIKSSDRRTKTEGRASRKFGAALSTANVAERDSN